MKTARESARMVLSLKIPEEKRAEFERIYHIRLGPETTYRAALGVVMRRVAAGDRDTVAAVKCHGLLERIGGGQQ